MNIVPYRAKLPDLPLPDPVSCGAFHCLTAPVPCMLMHTGQRVEYSAFAYVGIADQCYITEGNLLFLFFLQNYSPLNS